MPEWYTSEETMLWRKIQKANLKNQFFKIDLWLILPAAVLLVASFIAPFWEPISKTLLGLDEVIEVPGLIDIPLRIVVSLVLAQMAAFFARIYFL